MLRRVAMLAIAASITLLAAGAPAAPTPQFFTYYGLGSAFPEARDHVNLHWVVSWTGNVDEIVSQLRDARAAGMKAVLHAEFPFFAGACPFTVRSDATLRWRTLATELAIHGLLDTVIAVYPLDEPDLCGVSDADMQAVIAIIHDEPLTRDKKVAGLFTVDVAKKWGGHYRLTGDEHRYGGSLRALDWVGFDCYGCTTIYSETAWDTVRFDASRVRFVTVPGPTLYDNFKSQLDLSRQRLMVVPKASVGGPLFGTTYDDPALFRDRASADPDVVLLLPFTWFDQPGGVQGVRSIPALRASYTAIGRDIDARHPEATTAMTRAAAVEFYHRALGHYFVSASPLEVAALDSGVFPGWTRTGQSFSVLAQPPLSSPRAAAVCRYYGRPEAGLDSHFYSASADECAAVAAKFGASWMLESDNVFQVQLPDAWSGHCPLLTKAVYRVFNARPDANHRFTTSPALRDAMLAQGWIAEGYGADRVAMCAPE